MDTRSQSSQASWQAQRSGGDWNILSAAYLPEASVQIYTLGRFGVKLQGQPMAFSAMRRQRTLDLLQALIALGGRDVSIELLSQALWPDTDGDLAKNTFDVTLHRLRGLFGIKDLLIVREGHLSLNSEIAWVDTWHLEQLLNRCRLLLPRIVDVSVTDELASCEQHIQQIYQGSFLEREPVRPWAISLRERLRSKLLHYLMDAGRSWEQVGNPDRAIRCYRKGLELEPLAEELYQHLIQCYRNNQRMAEALATFRRCKQVLAEQLQIAPSPATLGLYDTLFE